MINCIRKNHQRENLMLATTLLFICSTAIAQDTNTTEDQKDDVVAYKLTPSYYRSSDGNDATDLNLRMTIGSHVTWLGTYHDRSGYNQTRAGYEFHQDADLVRIVWSGQVATRGFLGGSVTSEIGGKNYAIAGWGRTNLRDYYNLNFDPNDAITLGFGSRELQDTELSLFQIRDDRLDTRQRVTHFVVRHSPSDVSRWTIDASYKSGLSTNNVFVRGYALSLTYDYRSMFVRVAQDQFANFTNNRLTRVSLGTRF